MTKRGTTQQMSAQTAEHKSLKAFCIVAALLLSVFACGCQSPDKTSQTPPLFTSLSTDRTGIDFVNELSFSDDFNIFTYRNFYNGGGVALGDFNNDGLLDIYFTSNQQQNKLYLNKGDFKFKDVTISAGVAGKGAWSTGVSLADVNGDGWLDIYVSNSGDIKGDNKQNELFINNGNMTFTERAAEYGVDDKGYTTHAVFFDYDRDGDLDLYILNNSFQAIGSFNLRKNERGKRDPLGGHKLMRNDNGHFTDVSESAGIFGSVISFGLGVAVGDLNKDGWQDIYVSNDFFERDYLYLNNQNGTFRECLTEQMESVSSASMGADMADINNDGYPDVFVSEMLPETNARLKTMTAFDSWDKYKYNVDNGYFHQFSRNMLQLNNGNGTFSEIGRMGGVEASDWSWGALIFDMNNDGRKDIFVANGIYRDLTNQDYLQFASSEEVVKAVTSGRAVDYKRLIDAMPSTMISNYAFVSNGNYKFTNESAKLGLDKPGFSNGSAYGDLDNDGDLDLVVNNVNMQAFVYRNEASIQLPDQHYLKFILEGTGKNSFALGAQVTIFSGSEQFYIEQMPIRGFESSSDPRPNFGLGKLTEVDSVQILWPDGRLTRLQHLKTDQTIRVRQADAAAGKVRQSTAMKSRWFEEVSPATMGITFRQQENDYVDFNEDRLIYHMLSAEGPRVGVADVNGDGLEDFYIGGPKGQAGVLYEQQAGGKFLQTNTSCFEADKDSEDAGVLFFDADNDRDMDLYVASGGRELPPGSAGYRDRLYINSGKGVFIRSQEGLPQETESTSTVVAADYDGDGDLDLFTGSRLQPGLYGAPVSGNILQNDGAGHFTNVTIAAAPGLLKIGMIADAVFADIDGDKDPDLVVCGEYMPVTIFINNNKIFEEATANAGLGKSSGWWNKIRAADLDGDGDIDFVLGNHGLNSRFRASEERPVSMIVKDFDQNGTVEQIVSTWNGDRQYPLVLRHDLVAQLPSLRKKYLKYESYQDQTVTDFFSEDQLSNSVKLDAYTLATSVMINDGGGKFAIQALPAEAQFAPVYGIELTDVTGDGHPDIILGGNFYRARPDVGRYDASQGTVLQGDGKGKFTSVKQNISGLSFKGEVRDLATIKIAGKRYILVSRNSDSIQLFKVRDF